MNDRAVIFDLFGTLVDDFDPGTRCRCCWIDKQWRKI